MSVKQQLPGSSLGLSYPTEITVTTVTEPVTIDTSVPLDASLTGALPAGTNVIGAVSQSGSPWGVTVSNFPATQPVSIAAAVPVNDGGGSLTVDGTFWQATQPVSIAGTVAVSGPLTDTQLRASAVPVSATLLAGTAAFGKLAANAGVTIGAVEIAAAQTLATVTNLAQLGGSAIAMGTGVRSAGTQRVTIATDDLVPVSLATNTPVGNVASGAADAGAPLKIGGVYHASTPVLADGQRGDVQLSSRSRILSGTGGVISGQDALSNAGMFAWAADDDAATAARVGIVANMMFNGVTWDRLRGDTISGLYVQVKAVPALTKGTQGANGFSVQDLKDAGRTLFSAATVIGGVTAVATEALLSLVATRAGVAAAGATSLAVTAGKTLRVTSIVASVRSSAATVLSGRVALRMNPAGAVTATSPIIVILSMTQQAAALAEAGDTCVLPIPDGLEFSGTQQIGLTQVCSGTGGVVYASIVGFEY